MHIFLVLNFLLKLNINGIEFITKKRSRKYNCMREAILSVPSWESETPAATYKEQENYMRKKLFITKLIRIN